MATAGVPTGAAKALAEVGGPSRPLIRQILLSAPLEPRVITFGNSYRRTASIGLRSAGIGYSANYHRAATHSLAVRGYDSLDLQPGSARAASRRLAVHTHASLDPGLDRAPSRRRAAHDSAALDLQPRFLRASSTAVPNVLKPMCSATNVDETSEDPKPEVPTRWAKVVALLTKLNIGIIKLLLLGFSIWIGMLAVKEHPTATHIVNVCDKSHKVYNIASKGFIIIVELLKGDNK